MRYRFTYVKSLVILIFSMTMFFTRTYSSINKIVIAGNDSLRKNRIEIPVKFTDDRVFIQFEDELEESDIEDPFILPEIKLADTLEEQRERAHSLRDAVEKAQRFRESLDAYTITDLPIGIVKSGGEGLNYGIVIDKVNFTTKGSELTAYMSFVIPNNGKHIAFGGKIPLSKDGGIVGVPKIYLLGDHSMTIGSTLVTLKGSFGSKTFVEVDCNGFKGMSIEAEVEFSRDQLIPENEQGEKIDNQRVKINFQTYVQDWNELLVKINIPPFQIKGLDDVGFKISDAYIDWSDLTNPVGLVFPKDYQSSFVSSGNNNLWKGFFIRSGEIRLPSKFKEKNNGARIKIGVDNLIIDDTGFSGEVFVKDLIRDGDMNGWSYSLDQVRIGIVSNQLQQFQLDGKVTVPVLKIDDQPAKMGYLASRGADGNYNFAVSVLNRAKLPLWAADVNLYSGSSIVVVERNNKFYPTGTFNGMLSINALSNGPKAELSGIRFERLVISSEAPHFRSGTFGFGTENINAKASGYPLVIKNIGVTSRTADNSVGLSLDVTVNIGGDPSTEGFSGTAGLIIWGKMIEANTPSAPEKDLVVASNKEWKFEKVEITAVSISIKKPNVYDLSGSVLFFQDHPVYGDGFKGQFTGKLQKITVTATGLFGRTPTYRYWFADALVDIPSGVVIAPALAAYGFGGGFYSKMKQSPGGPNSIGMTPSGITYIPDENSIGLRAYLNFGGTPSKEAFNGDVTLQIAIARTGGMNVNLIGNLYFLTPSAAINIESLKNGASQVANKTPQALNTLLPKAQVYGSVNMLFDNDNDVFHGSVEVYANVLGGIVKGVGDRNKAGWATLHFASDDWYVLIGTPDQPVGLEVARIFQARSYFMMGKDIPDSPPPHPKVQEILRINNMNAGRDINVIRSGTGFAFGLNFGVDTGDLRFLMFYGRFSAGAGFDIMLKNWDGYHCEGSNEPIGINGWYAEGRAYAYIQSKIGIKVNLKFYKGDYDILAFGVASQLDVKGPNPFWMKGTVGGDYRILGGLVKGHCSFDVTIGKECRIIGESNPLQDVAIIAGVSPVKGSTDIDVFNAPQAAFNVPVGEIFDIKDIENNTRRFRVKLNEFTIKDGNSIIPAALQWNSTNDVVILDSRDILPSMKELKVKVKVQFEEQVGISWQTVTFQGNPVEEVVETSFTTGKAPDFIPPSNVSVSYPIAGQYNFYRNEYGRGFIKLKKGQPELFRVGPEWIQKAHITSKDNQQYKEFDFSYDANTLSVNFNIPADLPLSKIQKFSLLNIPAQNKVIDANVQKISTELLADNAGAAQLTTKDIEGKLDLLEVKSLYELEFRTSMYSTFSEKMSQLSLLQTYRNTVGYNVFQIGASIVGIEMFDEVELNGGNTFSRLVETEAELNGNNWYENFVYPLVYQGYPLFGFIRLKDRANHELLGIPPARAVSISARNFISVSNSQPSLDQSIAFSNQTLIYDLMIPMTVDYQDLQRQTLDYVEPRPGLRTTRITNLIMIPFPKIRYGSYKVNLRYRIPGLDQPTTSRQMELFNQIPDY